MKVLFGSIIVDAVGRLNGHVAKKTQFGNSITALALPRSRTQWMLNSAIQRNAWYFSQWNSLSLEQQQYANAFAAANPLPNRFGVLRNIGGRSMFIKMSHLGNFPENLISDPFGWENIAPSILFSIIGVNSTTGRISFDVEFVNEDCKLAIYVQQVSSTRNTPPSNRWRRIPNIIVEGSGVITSTFNIFQLVGTPRTGSEYWIKIVTSTGAGWSGATSVERLAVD